VKARRALRRRGDSRGAAARRETIEANFAIASPCVRRKPSSSTPFRRQYLAKPSSGNDAVEPSGSVTVCASMSMRILAPGAARSFACAAGSRTTGTRPFLSELFLKMSAMRVETIAWKP